MDRHAGWFLDCCSHVNDFSKPSTSSIAMMISTTPYGHTFDKRTPHDAWSGASQMNQAALTLTRLHLIRLENLSGKTGPLQVVDGLADVRVDRDGRNAEEH